MPIELLTVGFAAAFVVLNAIIAAGPRTLSSGVDWAAGPRDTAPKPVPTEAARLERAYRNLLDNFPLFAAAAIAVVVADASSALTAWGAQIWFWARVAYLPAYVFHVQMVRSVLWLVSMLGLAMLLWPLTIGAVL